MSQPASKPKVALYWCASCGGCEEAVVDLHEALLDVAAAVEIVLWPVALDFKYRDVEALADGSIAASLINGAIRTDEQLHMARLLRRKSALVLAFGSCAHLGGIPGLANLVGREAILRSSYLESVTVDNPHRTLPLPLTEVDGVSLTLPAFWPQVHTLAQAIEVDYFLPGCPPPPDLIAGALQAVVSGDLPPRGATLAPERALCDTCSRRASKDPHLRLERLYRPHEVIADPQRCFLDQGIICCGPATRSGCGEKCLSGNMPCTGCFGPAPGVEDQGARMLTALASLLGNCSAQEAAALARQVVDPAGTFNRYAVPAALVPARIHSEVNK